MHDFTSVCTYGAITRLYTTLEVVPTLTVSQMVFQLAACIVLRPPLPGEPWEGWPSRTEYKYTLWTLTAHLVATTGSLCLGWVWFQVTAGFLMTSLVKYCLYLQPIYVLFPSRSSSCCTNCIHRNKVSLPQVWGVVLVIALADCHT